MIQASPERRRQPPFLLALAQFIVGLRNLGGLYRNKTVLTG
ncbi:hypothetical protein HCH_04925 [Hahella chejuensis KCTC 2396]|uniref:Uncharacterized protein n=1 Tax=Hahella chejuensis (strain KCTC 2396) TaxID=349521 RepID=Q2SCL0_HAHCH|nr:hypothetical protein HCH_04925 [Hahella chejuensis KCTC 2396]